MTEAERDLSVIHYRPATRAAWCGATIRALARDDGTLVEVARAATTDISKVTCADCLERVIREANAARRSLTP